MTKNVARELREYQVAVHEDTMSFIEDPTQRRGHILIPTGGGKTVLFQYLILRILVCRLLKQPVQILVIHPRLILSYEQSKRIRTFLNAMGIKDIRLIGFHSGKHYAAGIANERQTTDPDKWVEDLEYANAKNEDHITFASYDSVRKLVTNFNFGLIICDEAHNLCLGNGYTKINETRLDLLISLAGEKVLYYTATPVYKKYGDVRESMSNEEIYGKCIAEVKPKDLHGPGFLVKPYVHLLNVSSCGDIDSDTFKIEQAVRMAFDQQYRDMVLDKKIARMKVHKMLMCTEDVLNDHTNINKHVHEIQSGLLESIGVKVNIVTIASSGNFVNGERSSLDREQLLEMVDKSEENWIIVHYDTLSEGIDMDSLTGAFITRGMNIIKLLQTIGRPARPAKEDLDESGNPIERSLRIKPYFPVTFMTYNGKDIAGNDSMQVIEWLLEAGYEHLALWKVDENDDVPGGKRDDDEKDPDPSARFRADIELDFMRRFYLENIVS